MTLAPRLQIPGATAVHDEQSLEEYHARAPASATTRLAVADLEVHAGGYRTGPCNIRPEPEGQVGVLILQPLRPSSSQPSSSRSSAPMIIVVDGVDECGDEQHR